MEKNDLKGLFCTKVSMELQRFKESMLKNEPEEIYGNAYRIDCMVNFCELLFESSEKMGKETMAGLLLFPNLLHFLYDRWLEETDSQMEELRQSVEKSVKELEGRKDRKTA